MALQLGIMLDIGLPAPEAYHKIDQIAVLLDKNPGAMISVQVYVSQAIMQAGYQPVKQMTFPIRQGDAAFPALVQVVTADSGIGLLKAAYNYLKSLTEYQGAISV
jgi:hypothetical protein